jgi:hypothetical protein
MSTTCTFSNGQSNIDNFHFKIKLLILWGFHHPSPSIPRHTFYCPSPIISHCYSLAQFEAT